MPSRLSNQFALVYYESTCCPYAPKASEQLKPNSGIDLYSERRVQIIALRISKWLLWQPSWILECNKFSNPEFPLHG